MTFVWTPHRFSGGALALDVANSVVMHNDDDARIDRFAVPGQLAAFAEAAGRLCDERSDFPAMRPLEQGRIEAFIALREDIDAYFRHRIRCREDSNERLGTLLVSISATLRHHGDTSDVPIDLATARSALKLVCHPQPERLKICPNCEWLFLDKSKNRSRNWCDMAVCGNRAKARLHYRRRKEGAS